MNRKNVFKIYIVIIISLLKKVKNKNNQVRQFASIIKYENSQQQFRNKLTTVKK